MINTYTLMMALVLLFAIFMRGGKKNSRAYIITACLLMFIILGLRDVTAIGNDTRSTYLWGFHNIASAEWSSLFQNYSMQNNSGFLVFEKIMNNLTKDDYQLYIALNSAFMLLVFAHFIYRYSTSPVQSFCYYWGLLFYLFIFSALKQSLAMTILLLAFDSIVDKKPVKYILLVLLAAQFHFPAMIFFPAYWFAKIKPGRYFVILLAVILLLTYLFRDWLLTTMMNAYEDETTEGIYTISGTRFLTNKAAIMLVIVVVAIALRRPTAEDRVYSIVLEFTAIAIVFQTFSTYSNIFERLADYYFQFSVVLIPMVFEHRAESQSILNPGLDHSVKSVATVIFCAFGVWRFADAIQADAVHFLPYRFFFQ